MSAADRLRDRRGRHLRLLAVTLALCIPAAAAAAASGAGETARASAQTAIAAFAAALKSELTSAMQAGGPVAAIEVCNSRAPAIAEAVSLENGMTLSRVSLRNRNPGNAPNDWQAMVLRQFEERRNAGERVEDLAWSETIETGSGSEFRLMKAIPTAPMCLTCHGETLTPEVATKIDELYPGDMAKGFQTGDIRGAFVVTLPLP